MKKWEKCKTQKDGLEEYGKELMYENGNRNNCKKNKNKDEKSMYRKGNKILEKIQWMQFHSK